MTTRHRSLSTTATLERWLIFRTQHIFVSAYNPAAFLRGRINFSGAAVAYTDNQFVTGYVSASPGDIFVIESDKSLTTNSYTGMVAYYKSDKSYIAQNTNTNTQVWVFSNRDMMAICKTEASHIDMAYVRFCVAYADIDNIKIYKQ